MWEDALRTESESDFDMYHTINIFCPFPENMKTPRFAIKTSAYAERNPTRDETETPPPR
jgi:hypothetical protein